MIIKVVISIACIIVILIIAFLIYLLQINHKIMATIVTFLGIVFIILPILNYFTNYDPFIALKEVAILNKNTSTRASEEAQTNLPIEVTLPKQEATETNSIKDSLSVANNNVQPIILNIGENVYRDENNEVYIIWTPISNQKEYKLKVEVYNPFLTVETQKEYICYNNWYNLDVSEYPTETIIFVSIATMDTETSEWVYSSSIHFTLY